MALTINLKNILTLFAFSTLLIQTNPAKGHLIAKFYKYFMAKTRIELKKTTTDMDSLQKNSSYQRWFESAEKTNANYNKRISSEHNNDETIVLSKYVISTQNGCLFFKDEEKNQITIYHGQFIKNISSRFPFYKKTHTVIFNFDFDQNDTEFKLKVNPEKTTHYLMLGDALLAGAIFATGYFAYNKFFKRS